MACVCGTPWTLIYVKYDKCSLSVSDFEMEVTSLNFFFH